MRRGSENVRSAGCPWRRYWLVAEALPGRGQDRVGGSASADGLTLQLADGAGGMAGGGRAADGAIAARRGRTGADAMVAARAFDARGENGGETTLGHLVVRAGRPLEVEGRSVGDSEAWCRDRHGWSELTQGQRRKPLLGSGRARPVPFVPRLGAERLLVVSDGLRTHAAWSEVLAVAEADDTAVERVVEALPSSHVRLIDDVSVLLLRPAPAVRLP